MEGVGYLPAMVIRNHDGLEVFQANKGEVLQAFTSEVSLLGDRLEGDLIGLFNVSDFSPATIVPEGSAGEHSVLRLDLWPQDHDANAAVNELGVPRHLVLRDDAGREQEFWKVSGFKLCYVPWPVLCYRYVETGEEHEA